MVMIESKVAHLLGNEIVLCCTLAMQVQEPILLLGKERFEGVDIRVRVKGGGVVSRIYGKKR